MNRRRLLARITAGHVQNVGFDEFVDLVEGFGFQLARTSGSHHVFVREGLPEQMNLQSVRGEAKPYQIRQFQRIVTRYNLRLEPDS